MVNDNQTTWEQNAGWFSGLVSKVKWLFQKSQKDWTEQKNLRLTRAFHLTRKDSVVSVLVSIVVVVWAVVYWGIVWNQYSEINARSDELKNLESYNIVPNWDKLSVYDEWNSMSTINWMISVNNKVEEEVRNKEIFKQQQKSYYEVLLQNIYLPSLNVWKDPYTKNFNMSILWQRYLEKDKFQDLYLIQYWSDFVKYVWNDADYNVVDNITVWDKQILNENPEYFYTPITISFSSPNKRSFLLLVNKLSTTSNQSNISLLNEFFFYLLWSIRENKSEEIDSLMEEYWEDFSSSSSWDLPTDYEELMQDEEKKSIYRESVIWYNLYHWINWDLPNGNESSLVDEEVIMETIKSSASCDNMNDVECLYNFRNKYRNLPYLAYGIWLDVQNNRTSWLLGFLQDLPPAIAITSFGFEKNSNSSFLNNKEEEYRWSVSFNAYGRNITEEELDEASAMLWKLCFGNATDQKISSELALSLVNDTIASYGWELKYQNVSSLWELQTLFTTIGNGYSELNNYEKMVKLFEIWRMMNDANLCNK